MLSKDKGLLSKQLMEVFYSSFGKNVYIQVPQNKNAWYLF